MAAEELVVHGAREHNLKEITVRLPRNRLICITGLSGSGKSSLAFDTIYAEGQRRYVESLSASSVTERWLPGIWRSTACHAASRVVLERTDPEAELWDIETTR